MNKGRTNIAAGFLLIAAFMMYGFVLVYFRDFASGKEEWIASYTTGKHFEARLAHAHGNLFGVLNVVLGLVLPRLSMDERRRKVLAVLGIAGILMPLGILAEVYLGAPPVFVLIGGASMLVAMLWTGLVVARQGLGDTGRQAS